MVHGLRVVHYINQFFAGLGGEDRSSEPPLWRSEPVGPGLLLQTALADRGKIVGTIICGDNYFCENESQSLVQMTQMIRAVEPDVIVAGPAFNSGRYGLACVSVCSHLQEQLKTPAVTALHPENPAVEIGRKKHLWMAKTDSTALGMKEAISSLAQLTWKVASGVAIGSSEDENYIPRGFRRNALVQNNGAERAVSLLLKRLRGEEWSTELPLPDYDRVSILSPIADLADCTLAIVTESGVVPSGNPDRLESWRASKWFKYSIEDLSELARASYYTVHGGFENTWVNDDPHRAVPLDALRRLESRCTIGRLHPYYYVTTGMATTLSSSQRLGREMASDLRGSGVNGVLLTAT
jgi:glycine reductase